MNDEEIGQAEVEYIEQNKCKTCNGVGVVINEEGIDIPCPNCVGATIVEQEQVEETVQEVLTKKINVALDSQILSTVMACGRLTDFRFGHHFQAISGKSKSLEKGSIVHAYMRDYYKAIISGKGRSEAHSLGIIAAQEYAKSEEVRNTPHTEREHAIKTCDEYFDFYKNDHWVPLEVEKVKGKILYEDDEVRILYKVKFDLVSDTTQGIYPIDHKTMSQRRDTLTLNNQFIGQCIVQGTRVSIVNKVGFQTSLKPNEKFQ